MKRKLKKKSGFTLVELIVVIAVLAILAVVAVPAYNGVQDAAENSRNMSEARSCVSALNAFNALAPEDDRIDADAIAAGTLNTTLANLETGGVSFSFTVTDETAVEALLSYDETAKTWSVVDPGDA